MLVQLDDDLVERLDRLAEQEGTSRSELLRRARRRSCRPPKMPKLTERCGRPTGSSLKIRPSSLLPPGWRPLPHLSGKTR